MPNGSGILFGCFLCQHFMRNEEDPLVGYCRHHDIDTDMSFVCKSMIHREIISDNMIYRQLLTFHRNQLVKFHTRKLEPNVLYRYIQLPEISYPPPIEKVPLANIKTYQNLDNEQRQDLNEEARQRALEQYHARLRR